MSQIKSSRQGVAKPLPGGKKVLAKTFLSALWTFLKVTFFVNSFENLSTGAESASDMVCSNSSVTRVKFAVFCDL